MQKQEDTFRERAISHALAYFDDGRFQRELATLVGYPTESQNPESAFLLREYLEKAIAPILKTLGFSFHIHDSTEERPPILTAQRIEDNNLPTILTYGHGDVILGQADQWREGLEPFVLTQEGDRYFGRGTADNKSQHLINLRALASLLEAQGRLGFNVKLLLEMGEERGSPGLKVFCENHRERLSADVFIASDGPRLAIETPTIFLGSRGGISFDLVVTLRDGAHHSGNFGGLLADPAMILAQALSCITDNRGQIRVPEWRPASLSPRIRELLSELPAHDTGIALDDDWGESSLSAAERVFGWNSFTILAMTSGNPEAPMNAIAGSARAACQLRYVVGTETHEVLPALRRHLDQNGFDQIEIEPHDRNFFPATRLDPDHPMVRFITESIRNTVGCKPHLLPNLGGSLPNDCFAEVLELPTIWIPHSYAGCSQHAPNEHILKPLSRQALQIMTGLFVDISESRLVESKV